MTTSKDFTEAMINSTIRKDDKYGLNDVLESLKNHIDREDIEITGEILKNSEDDNTNNDLPNWLEKYGLLKILENSKENGKIKRPANSNIIYTNLLNRHGILATARTICEFYHLNKQQLMPIAKKLSTVLWKELEEEYHNFFMVLALMVKKEHNKRYPDYVYKPRRNNNNKQINFKPYDPEQKRKNAKRTNCPKKPKRTNRPLSHDNRPDNSLQQSKIDVNVMNEESINNNRVDKLQNKQFMNEDIYHTSVSMDEINEIDVNMFFEAQIDQLPQFNEYQYQSFFMNDNNDQYLTNSWP